MLPERAARSSSLLIEEPSFLSRLCYRETGGAPGTLAIRAALDQFEAVALFDGERRPSVDGSYIAT
jgi:hypothetical protein